MSRRLILILALALMVGVTSAAYAEVQNVKVSGDIKATAVGRHFLTLRKDRGATSDSLVAASDFNGNSVSAILTQARVRVDADLTDNVSTTVRLLNERVWGEEHDTEATAVRNDTAIDLDLAYVTMKEFLYSPLTLTVGRQELRYGNALIIGDVDTNIIAAGHGTDANKVMPNSLDDLSLRKSFDAVKAVLNYDPLIVDLVYATIDRNSVANNNRADLYGLNAVYTVNKDLLGELYYWNRTRKGDPTGANISQPGNKKETLHTIGGRVVYGGIENLNLQLESAYQFGNHIRNTTLYPDEVNNDHKARKVSAWALQAIAGYKFAKVKYTPDLAFVYTYLSGDPYKTNSNKYRGWDPMFEDQDGGTLKNKIASPSNTHSFDLLASAKPADDWKLSARYAMFLLAEAYNSDYGSTANNVNLSGVAGDPTYRMRDAKVFFGQEIDLGVTYDYTEDVQLSLDAGRFVPGDAFEKTDRNPATQVIGSMKVTF